MKCKECGTKFTPRFFLQKTCENPRCIIDYSKKVYAKQQDKEWKQRKKETKEKLKTLSHYESEAKRSFQKWVRMRDKDLPCISCGTTTTMRWDGGHLFKAEIYSGVIFDERNVNKQCIKCNVTLNGNEAEYSIRLRERLGEKEFLDLQEKALRTRLFKYTKDELIEIKKKYDKLLNG